MGHCLSCFRERADVDLSTTEPAKKDEITNIIATSQAPAVIVPICPQEQPLLHENDNNIIYNNALLTSGVNNIESGAICDEPCIEESFPIKTHIHVEKTTKSFNKKFPSIPRTMPPIGTNDCKVSEARILQLFDQYKDSLDHTILAEGIENLCNDLQLNPDSFKILVLAWKLNASQMCRFTKTEFTQGLKNLKTDSIKGIQLKLTQTTNELKNDAEQFKDLYRFTFKFGLDVNSGQRILPSDIAIVLWRLVFTNNEPAILDRWLGYLEKNSHIRGIPKDTWYMFLNFCEFVGDDLSSYDDTEAWPSLFDDFVEHENDQLNQNLSKDDIKIDI